MANITQDELKKLEELDKGLKEKIEAIAGEKKAAEELAEKFRKDNDEAQKIIQSKGSEIGELRKQLGEDGAGKETIADIEASMTDEEWALADKFLETVTDPVLKKKLVTDDKERAKVLKMIKEDVDIKAAPLSFRRNAEEKKKKVEDGVRELFQGFKKQHGFIPAGPSGSVRSGSAAPVGFVGGNKWPSDDARKVDTRVR